MDSNPYQPPSVAAESAGLHPVLRMLGQAAVFIYGLGFTLFCVFGSISDLVNREPVFQSLLWLVLSVVTCFGIFALAIPQLRFQWVGRAWRYVAYLLPVVTYAATAWEIWNGGPMDAVMFIAVLTLFLIVTTPALVFNILLHRKLNVRPAR